MKLETPYGDVEPQVSWGDCPNCDGVDLEWYEEGPICPSCGHLWDSNGGDIGSWDENMGTEWAESNTRRLFVERNRKQTEWLTEILGRSYANATGEEYRV